MFLYIDNISFFYLMCILRILCLLKMMSFHISVNGQSPLAIWKLEAKSGTKCDHVKVKRRIKNNVVAMSCMYLEGWLDCASGVRREIVYLPGVLWDSSGYSINPCSSKTCTSTAGCP